MAFIIKELSNDETIRNVKVETKDLRSAKINASRLQCDSNNILQIESVKKVILSRKINGFWLDCIQTEWVMK